MSAYALGVDLGTTFTAAAIARGSSVQPMQLGTDAAQVPSVVLFKEDGEVLVGDAAERRAASEPDRAAREFKRRLGDPVPLLVAGRSVQPEELMAHLLRDVVRRATEQEGEAPTTVVLTHPANYTDFKTGLLRRAAELAGLEPSRVSLLTEPEAAAVSYTRQQPIQAGEVIAVYDFGGGTFDAALVRRTAERFELVGVPEGLERLGGIDFDQAVFAHVDASVDRLVSSADRSDPQTLPAQLRLRGECRRAKEALSVDGDTTIAVTMPGVQTSVRLTRDEFETMVRPRVADTVRALERTVASAGLRMDEASRVLLVGGSSRMPVIAEMVRGATGLPIALDSHPKLAIATGAALLGGAHLGPPPPAPVSNSPAAAVADAAWQAPTRVAPPAPPAPRGRRTWVWVLVGLVAGALAVAGVLLLSGGDEPSSTSVATSGPSITDAATSETPSTVASTGTASTVVAPTAEVSSSAPSTTSADVAAGGSVDLAGLGDSGIPAVSVGPDGAIHAAMATGEIVRVEGDTAVVVATLDPAEGTPGGLAVAADGAALVSGTSGVWELSAESAVLRLPASAVGSWAPGPVAVDGVGNVYAVDRSTGRILRAGSDGSLSLVAGAESAIPVGDVTGIVIDGSGSLWFTDTTSGTVRVISSTGEVRTIAGGGTAAVTDGASALDVAFGSLNGIAVDPTGTVSVTDAVDGVLVSISGDGGISVVVGDGTGVPLTDPGSLTAGRDGTLWFADGTELRFTQPS